MTAVLPLNTRDSGTDEIGDAERLPAGSQTDVLQRRAETVYARQSNQRVLHIVPALFGPSGVFGGAERYALELARHMARLTPTKLLTFGDRDDLLRLDDLQIRVIGKPVYVRNQRANPISARIFAEVCKADVVHCHQQHVVASSLAALTSRLLGRKVFVTDLGGGGWDLSAYVNTDRWYSGHLHISKYSRRVSEHEERSWSHVIYGGVDTEKFCPDPKVKRDGSVLFVGRLLPHESVEAINETGLKLQSPVTQRGSGCKSAVCSIRLADVRDLSGELSTALPRSFYSGKASSS